MPDFPCIEHFGRLNDSLVELRLIYETRSSVHNPLLRVAQGYWLPFNSTSPTNSTG
jgi:hypothetical protein